MNAVESLNRFLQTTSEYMRLYFGIGVQGQYWSLRTALTAATDGQTFKFQRREFAYLIQGMCVYVTASTSPFAEQTGVNFKVQIGQLVLWPDKIDTQAFHPRGGQWMRRLEYPVLAGKDDDINLDVDNKHSSAAIAHFMLWGRRISDPKN